VFLFLFMLVAAPLAGFLPLAALGAVLAVVAWNMAEREDFILLLRSSRGDRIVLLTTFLLTVFVDLTTGISVGVVLGAFVFLHRMAESVEVQGHGPLIVDDEPDDYSDTLPMIRLRSRIATSWSTGSAALSSSEPPPP